LAADNGQQDSIATAITQVSENLTRLVHDEIELAKAEVTHKGLSLLRGVGAVAAGAVFGVFAVVTGLITIGWALDAILVNGVGEIWLGFLIVTGVLLLLAVFAFLFAWRKLRVGAPMPTMAMDEAKRIRETVSTSAGKS
jgi:Putative Actinobacterial Holin-X, holin superfamily III